MEKLMAGWLNPYANATFGVLRNFPPILPIKCPLWVKSGHYNSATGTDSQRRGHVC